MKKNLIIPLICFFGFLILPLCNKAISKIDINSINSRESALFPELVGEYVDLSLTEKAVKELGEIHPDLVYGTVFDSNGTCHGYIESNGCVGFKMSGKWAVKDSMLFILFESSTISKCDSNQTESTKAFRHANQLVYKIKSITNKELIVREEKCLFCKDKLYKRTKILIK